VCVEMDAAGRYNGRRDGGLMAGMGGWLAADPPKFSTLLLDVVFSFQPFTSTFATVAIRCQATSQPHPNDSLVGLWRFLFPRSPESEAEKKRKGWDWRLALSASALMMVYQILEGYVVVVMTNCIWTMPKVLRRFLIEAKDLPSPPLSPTTTLASSSPPASASSSPVAPSPSQPLASSDLRSPASILSWFGLRVLRSAVYVGVAGLSHPFSIIRTGYLVNGKLPGSMWETTHSMLAMWHNGVYMRSYWAHVAAGLTNYWCIESAHSLLLPLCQSSLPSLFPPPTTQTVSTDAARPSPKQRALAHMRQQMAKSTFHFLTGFTGQLLAFPLSTLRYRLEAQGSGPLCEKQYDGLVSCARFVWEEEGFSGLYRGLHAHMGSLVAHMGWMGGLYLLAWLIVEITGEEEEEEKEEADYYDED